MLEAVKKKNITTNAYELSMSPLFPECSLDKRTVNNQDGLMMERCKHMMCFLPMTLGLFLSLANLSLIS
jgi:hypothetical protein